MWKTLDMPCPPTTNEASRPMEQSILNDEAAANYGLAKAKFGRFAQAVAQHVKHKSAVNALTNHL